MKKNCESVYQVPEIEIIFMPVETICSVSAPVEVGDYPGLGDEQVI